MSKIVDTVWVFIMYGWMSVHIQYGYVCSMYRRSVLTADLLTGSNNNTYSARAETLWRFLFVFIYNLYTFIYYYGAYGSFTLDAGKPVIRLQVAVCNIIKLWAATCLHTVEICLELTKLGVNWLCLGYIPI